MYYNKKYMYTAKLALLVLMKLFTWSNKENMNYNKIETKSIVAKHIVLDNLYVCFQLSK